MEEFSFANMAWKIFLKAVEIYHKYDNVDECIPNPYKENTIEHTLFNKVMVDTVQWHLEDIIRDENITPEKALTIKRRIDASNQKRTDIVESIDDWFLQKYKDVKLKKNFRLNTETPAWAIDRLSILALKIYHMNVEAMRFDATKEHRHKCQEKLETLILQKLYLELSIDQLLKEIEEGKVKITTYKQMKMYNDESLNPILYQNKK